MTPEQLEIAQYIGQFEPFDAISDDAIELIAQHLQVRYFKAGSAIINFEEPATDLMFIRSGAVELFRRNGELYNRLTEGDIFGQFSLLRQQCVRFPARALEDCLIYYIPKTVFEQLLEEEAFADFVEAEGPRLKTTVEQQRKDNDLLITRVRKLVRRRPLIVDEDTTIQQASQQLIEHGASSMLVRRQASKGYEEDNQTWQICGLITEHDFVSRVIAQGESALAPVANIMSREMIGIASDESVQEAMLIMLKHNIHHLPVFRKRRPLGIIRLADIVRYETQSSLYLAASIANQQSIAELAKLSHDVAQSCVRMVQDGANSKMVGQALSGIGRAFMQRIIELTEADLGKPPVPYCYMVLGSMARDEQTLLTDQDNALILHDDYQPEHEAYFVELSDKVSTALDRCGYTLCSGDIMASNPQWRKTLSQWQATFADWIANPNPEALLHCSIFFDIDGVYGDINMAEELREFVAERAQGQQRFLAALARNALNRTPPLGLFRTFVLEKDGKENNSINVKRRGTAPLVDVIRVHALAAGSTAQNSFDRLDDIAKTSLIPKDAIERLRYAFEFLSMMRIRHQVIDIDNERQPDNNVEPELVNSSDRHTLKDAFGVLSSAQKYLEFRYPYKVR
ncbi:DUF294 nucleotidyltransferase-like domain-containing protein [Salinibius halmophilus]|uniref:DUF294 nucleotidyltransferase-like domain-containing protein n=1 Tax=Salinibius halmophilus TaxID=1853216 RepID=UPI000E672607|nr:DUF294 nucleotidyltransferase-like domain-containing protein [Salinibius halmophilus]